MRYTLTLTAFTPAQAERISGIALATQRDYRRRGYLPQNEGHARFNAFDLAEMLVLNELAAKGIGPKEGLEVSKACAVGIVYNALAHVEAYEGDHLRAYEWNAAAFPGGIAWAVKADWLRRTLLTEHGYHAAPAHLFCWWADGSKTFEEGILVPSDPSGVLDQRWCGPVVVLSLKELGLMMLRRAGVGLVHFELEQSE